MNEMVERVKRAIFASADDRWCDWSTPDHPECVRMAQAAAGAVLAWTRCGDALPGLFEPVLTAKWDADQGVWRVYDGKICIGHEGVIPSTADLADGKLARDWWFDSVYPGKGNMRLGHEDLLWARMPTPEMPKR